jgi:hypothetical protein
MSDFLSRQKKKEQKYYSSFFRDSKERARPYSREPPRKKTQTQQSQQSAATVPILPDFSTTTTSSTLQQIQQTGQTESEEFERIPEQSEGEEESRDIVEEASVQQKNDDDGTLTKINKSIKIYSNLFELDYLFLFLDNVSITRKDAKILIDRIDQQTATIQKLEREVSDLRKLLEKHGVGDFTSDNEFINVSIYYYYY